jgi:hypothetical protein
MEKAWEPGRNMLGNDLAIYETVKLSAPVFPHTANTPFPFFDLAPVLAKITADLASRKGYVKHCLFHIVLPLSFANSPLALFSHLEGISPQPMDIAVGQGVK